LPRPTALLALKERAQESEIERKIRNASLEKKQKNNHLEVVLASVYAILEGACCVARLVTGGQRNSARPKN